jgi:hypothetical protein
MTKKSNIISMKQFCGSKEASVHAKILRKTPQIPLIQWKREELYN